MFLLFHSSISGRIMLVFNFKLLRHFLIYGFIIFKVVISAVKPTSRFYAVKEMLPKRLGFLLYKSF